MLTRRGAAHPKRALASAPLGSSRHGTDGTAAETTGGKDRARSRPVANPCPRAARVHTHRCPRSERMPNGKPPRPHPLALTVSRCRRASLRPNRAHTAALRSLGHVPKHDPCQPVPRATTPMTQRPSTKGAGTARVVMSDPTPLPTVSGSRTQPPSRPWPRRHADCTTPTWHTVLHDSVRRTSGTHLSGEMSRARACSDDGRWSRHESQMHKGRSASSRDRMWTMPPWWGARSLTPRQGCALSRLLHLRDLWRYLEAA